jgi:isopentenyl phosphate kinase
VIILKLGGSLITDKEKKFSVRRDVLNRVAAEIREGRTEELIIVHGGGSFGHPVAAKYKLQEGLKDREQVKGITLTRRAMGELNLHVVEALTNNGIPAVALQPSASIVCRKGRIRRINLEVIKGFLDLRAVPVLYGDVVLDEEQGFCILSGDQIVSYLAEALRAERVILATDVNGVYDKDPRKFGDAKLIAEISRENVNALENLESIKGDVTGGIKGKLLELVALAEKGIESIIINALKEGRLKKALLRKEVTCTRVVF